jgi:hypothetical protein
MAVRSEIQEDALQLHGLCFNQRVGRIEVKRGPNTSPKDTLEYARELCDELVDVDDGRPIHRQPADRHELPFQPGELASGGLTSGQPLFQ